MKDINATIIIELEGKTEDEIYRNFDYSRRKNIQKAIRAGIYYEESYDPADLKKCYEINSKVLRDGGAPTKSYEEWMKFVNPDKNKFFVIKLKKKLIGCFAIREITRKFYNLNSNEKGIRPLVFANKSEYNDYRPNDLMYWATILYGVKNGYSFVDLGGWQIKARGHLKGVNSFKEKWGGKVTYFYSEYPFSRAIGRKLIRNFGLFWWLNKKLKANRKS